MDARKRDESMSENRKMLYERQNTVTFCSVEQSTTRLNGCAQLPQQQMNPEKRKGCRLGQCWRQAELSRSLNASWTISISDTQ